MTTLALRSFVQDVCARASGIVPWAETISQDTVHRSLKIDFQARCFESILTFVSDRAFFLTLQAIDRQLAGMPNDFYFIRLIHGSTHRPAPGERLWTAAELMRATVVRFLRAHNQKNQKLRKR